MIHFQVSEDIEVLWEKLDIAYETLEDTVGQVLDFTQTTDDVELTIVIGSDALLQELNQKYLDIDAPTDVLSFLADFVDPDSVTTYLGDLVISIHRALAQAEAGGHAIKHELQLLIVHGLLHLLEYDHVDDDEKAAMQETQDAILKILGNPAQVTL